MYYLPSFPPSLFSIDVGNRYCRSDQINLQRLLVSWDEWTTALLASGKQGREVDKLVHDETIFRKFHSILDQHSTGMVKMHTFNDFLKGFGPFEFFSENTLEILSSDWFLGFLGMAEVEYLLQDKPVGTYLVRFSRSVPGSFAIGMRVNSPVKPIFHILIDSEPDNQFSVKDPKGKHMFETISEIIIHYARLLICPLKTRVPIFSAYNFGELTEEEAEDNLASVENGSYLLRFQLIPPCFVISYRFEDVAYHSNIKESDGKIGFDGDPDLFLTFGDLLTSYREVLIFPMEAKGNIEEPSSAESSSSAESPQERSSSDVPKRQRSNHIVRGQETKETSRGGGRGGRGAFRGQGPTRKSE